MDIFALTETEFFRQLLAGEKENLHITYRDFIVQVFEMCRTNRNKGYAVSALLVVEIEISHLQTEADRNAVNTSLTSFISKALHFVRETISNLKNVIIEPATDDELLQDIGLKWSHKKVALVEIGYAFHLAKCFGDRLTVKDVILRLAKAFDVDITENLFPDGVVKGSCAFVFSCRCHRRMSLECCEYHFFNLRAVEFRVEKPAYEKSAPRRFEFPVQLAVC